MLQSCRQESGSLRIAAAANLQYALDSLIAVFESEHHIKCEAIYGPSIRLATQIEQGAPYDILLSAESKGPERLYGLGLAAEAPRAFTTGAIAIFSRRPIKEIQELSNERHGRIAVPNPKVAPFGALIKEWLESFDLLKDLEKRLVYGESVGQTNQFFLSGHTDVIITSESLRHSTAYDNEVSVLEPVQAERLTHYGQALKQNSDNAQKFMDFIFESEAQSILKHFGYSNPLK